MSDGRGQDGEWPTWALYLYDVVSAVLGVVLVAALLLAVSGVWPPLVAIESPSMEPHILTGDLVFVMDNQRFEGPGAHPEAGIVTARTGDDVGYRTFDGPGDVIVFEPRGNSQQTPIIHRAMFYVEDEENWYAEANARYVGAADSCRDLRNCPAPYAGFITMGDNNNIYDQATGSNRTGPVRTEWIIGTAEARVPALGNVRLSLQEVLGADSS